MPLVSIVIPTYNRAHLIGQTLESVRQQTLKDWECLVVDDFSTDNTKVIVEDYCKNDSRFHYMINERTKGAPGARNTGLIRCNSPWVIFFDSDNIMHTCMMDSLYEKLAEENVDVVTCWSNKVDRNLGVKVGMFNWVCNGDIQDGLITGNVYVDTNSALISREKLEKINGWSEDCPSFQEWDLHLRLSQVSKYTTVKEPLADYYVNGNDTISKDRHREIEGYLYVLEKHRSLWNQYPAQYLQYGKRVLEIIQDTKDYQCLHRLFLLCPKLRKEQAMKQLKTIYRIIKCSNK